MGSSSKGDNKVAQQSFVFDEGEATKECNRLLKVASEKWDTLLQQAFESKPKRSGSMLRWYGGKGKIRNKLMPLLDYYPHDRYVEPFGGGASILLAKTPVDVEVYNDIDAGLSNFFFVISSPELFPQFYRQVVLVPYSRVLFDECLENWSYQTDRVDMAVMWFVVARASFSGMFGHSFSSSTFSVSRGMAGSVARWLSCLDSLPQFHSRLKRVQVENQDWKTILTRYDSPTTLFYLDPPYPHSTRQSFKSRKIDRYSYELTEEDHLDIAKTLLNIKGHAVLSSYPGHHYDVLLESDWIKYEFGTTCMAVGRTDRNKLKDKGSVSKKQRRTEVAYSSPRP